MNIKYLQHVFILTSYLLEDNYDLIQHQFYFDNFPNAAEVWRSYGEYNYLSPLRFFFITPADKGPIVFVLENDVSSFQIHSVTR